MATRSVGDFCWINMITPQPAAARAFFGSLLGWTFVEMPGMGHGIQVAGHDIGGLFDPLSLASYQGYLSAARVDRSSSAYQDLNVRYIVADVEQGSPATGYREALRADDGIVLWEAPSWRPRAWVEGSDAALDVRRTSSDSLAIAVPAGVSGRLIVSQAAYPGWRATVDGTSTPIAVYDGALQSIELPAGAQTVRLEFQPSHWWLWVGLAIVGALGWLGVAAWVALGRWRRPIGTLSTEPPAGGDSG